MTKPPRRAAGRANTARARTASSARKPAGRTAVKRARKATTAKRPDMGARKKTSAARKAVSAPSLKKSRKKTAPAKTITSSRARAVTGRAHAPSTKRKAAPPASRSTKKPTGRRALPDDFVPTPPSTLNMDRSASAARSGRRALVQHIHDHKESGPSLTAGDVDANWELAYSSGDEAPGGDNPTPDQDVVDDIARAIGVEYNDNEELRGSDKVADRDKHRWELDPASSDDYQERVKKK